MKPTRVIVDVEADGPCPGLYSMVSFGAVLLSGPENDWKTFYSGVMQPLTFANFVPEALAVSGHSREDCLNGARPLDVMRNFDTWVREHCDRPMFYSDNNGFDWQFINYYFHCFVGSNPFGYSSTNIGSLYKGLEKDLRANFKKLRRTKHTHHPVDDARGNAEALEVMLRRFNR